MLPLGNINIILARSITLFRAAGRSWRIKAEIAAVDITVIVEIWTQITVVTGFTRQTRVAQSYARIDIVASLSTNFAVSHAGYAHGSIPGTAVVEAVQLIDTHAGVTDTRVANVVAVCKHS